MGTHYTQHKSHHICVDVNREEHGTSSKADQNGALLYTTEMERGSSDTKLYPHNREVSCAVCSPLPVTTSNAVNCKGSCYQTAWKNDGHCDDQNNICGCDWDGGDCCAGSDMGQCRDPKRKPLECMSNPPIAKLDPGTKCVVLFK